MLGKRGLRWSLRLRAICRLLRGRIFFLRWRWLRNLKIRLQITLRQRMLSMLLCHLCRKVLLLELHHLLLLLEEVRLCVALHHGRVAVARELLLLLVLAYDPSLLMASHGARGDLLVRLLIHLSLSNLHCIG